MKKRGFGMGRWNGFGGKVEPGETIEEAAHRELMEEASVSVSSLEKAGTILCAFAAEPFLREVHVFRASRMVGEPKESEEMLPQWFDDDSLPFERMWESDAVWFPSFLERKLFHANLSFDETQLLLTHELIVL